MNLTRSQLSLLITGFSLGIVVLILFNIHLGTVAEEEYVIELSLDEEDLEELLREEEPPEPEASESVKSHMAYNETAKPSFGEPEPLKTLEELMEEREASEAADDSPLSDSGAYAANLKKLAQKREEARQLLGEKEAKKKEYTDYLKDRRTSISYSLVDRRAYDLPPPIYTCIEGGKVVINIEVNGLGQVVDAQFNAKSSGTSNGCLVENALAYAMKARFNPSDRNQQKGSITYLFQGK